jgi:hypothetical protein
MIFLPVTSSARGVGAEGSVKVVPIFKTRPQPDMGRRIIN